MSDYFHTNTSGIAKAAPQNKVAKPKSPPVKVSDADKIRVAIRVTEAFTAHCGEPIVYADGRQMFACPSHGDDTPSLSLKEGDEGMLIKCFGGCETKDVLGEVGLDWADIHYVRKTPQGPPVVREVGRTVYEYRYTNGSPGGTSTRVDVVDSEGNRGKRYECRLDKVDGQVSPLLIYGQERIQEAQEQDRLVWVVEGEKAVDALAENGEVAVSLYGGAGAAHNQGKVKALSDIVRGMRVVLCPDNDRQGRAWLSALQGHLSQHARVVFTITDKRLNGGDNGYDIADLLDDNPFIEDLREELSADGALERNSSEAKPLTRTKWVHNRRVPCGALTLLGAPPGVGKTSYTTWMAAQLTRGSLEGEFLGKPQHIAWVSLEESENKIRSSFVASGADMRFVHIVTVTPDGDTVSSHDWWQRTVKAWCNPALIVIDPLAAFLDDKDGVSDKRVRMAMAKMMRALRFEGSDDSAIVGLKHFRKASYSEMTDVDITQLFSGTHAGNVGLARSALVIYDEDVDGERVLHIATSKANLVAIHGTEAPAIVSGRIVGKDIEVSDGTTNVGVFVVDPSLKATTFEEAIAKKRDKGSSDPDLDETVEEVRKRLSEDGWIRSSEVDDLMTENGLIVKGMDEGEVKALRQKVRRKVGKPKAAKQKGSQVSGWLWFNPERMTFAQAQEVERMVREAPEPHEVQDPAA